MLAEQSLTAEIDPMRLQALVAETGATWQLDLARGGDDLLAKFGVHVAGVPLYKRGHVGLGPARLRLGERRTLLPVTWEATGGPPIFPAMEGELTVEAINARHARFTLRASYDPPLKQVGAAIDRVLLHRLADATIIDFLERLAAYLRTGGEVAPA